MQYNLTAYLYYLAAISALMVISGHACFEDLQTRTVTRRLIVISYVFAMLLNVLSIVVFIFTSGNSSGMQYQHILEMYLSAHAGQYIVAAVLSVAGIVMWMSRLLAAGDAITIPALLFMFVSVASSPFAVAVYYILAVALVLVASIVTNIYNNSKYRDRLYGPEWHRMYLMTFCRYGDGNSVKHAFVYGDARRDYDNEQFYSGDEKTWLMPGLPLLAGFMPSVVATTIIFMPALV